MKRSLLFAALVVAVSGCGSTAGVTPDAGTGAAYNSKEKIETFLDGKILVMEGANIPTDPNGINENLNAGQATQCYKRVAMKVTGTTYQVTSQLGKLEGAATAGQTGTCNRTVSNGNPLVFSSTNTLVENVAEDGSCFDFTATYNGFSQEGRGKVAQDGKTLSLELYFGGQATGHRCANGAVGAATVKLKGADFTGKSTQVYAVQTEASLNYNTKDKVETFLNNKTLVMEGANIPTHPNGIDQNKNAGQATQCYKRVTMKVTGTTYQVTSELGTVEGAATVGQTGTCNHDLVNGNPLVFSSTATLVENVTGDGSCFDFTATYNGFSQEGRGRIDQDGKTLSLELYFGGQATGHRCAQGAVGAATVKLGGADFTGKATQVYAVQTN